MKQGLKYIGVLSLMLGLLVAFTPQEESAKDIIQKAIDLSNGISSKGEVEMKIVRTKWTRTVKMKSWSLGSDYSMILITAPAADKGQVFMKRDKDMWNYIPKINRMIKMPPSMMSQGWMGSDMSNDDMVKMNSLITDYDHKILGSETVNGIDCHKIQLIPHEDAAVVWGKIEIWIAKNEYYQMKTIQYDEDMEAVTKTIASEIKQYGTRSLPSKFELIPMDKKGQKTIVTTISQEFDIELKEDFFTQQNMKRVR